jgi:hypothetical protein
VAFFQFQAEENRLGSLEAISGRTCCHEIASKQTLNGGDLQLCVYVDF